MNFKKRKGERERARDGWREKEEKREGEREVEGQNQKFPVRAAKADERAMPGKFSRLCTWPEQ